MVGCGTAGACVRVSGVKRGGLSMHNARSLPFSMALVLLFAGGTVARSQDTPHEDLTPCTGSSPQPSKSAEWPVAFCNRTGHDVVIEFRDNDCPATNWGKRGDVYRKS